MDGTLVFLMVVVMIFSVEGAVNVTINILESATAKGAVCLDGTPPSYAYSPGFGDGAQNWHVYLQGGGWCWSSYDCFNRSSSPIGSSTVNMRVNGDHVNFDGLLENSATLNPDFYNWNVVFVLYCDGSSFMSDVEEVDPVYNITYRGARIFDVVMEDLLLRKGMVNAENALLSGTSAGGLATILHCDKFRSLFPNNETRVKCLSDSGFFIHGEELIGADWREERFHGVISTHGLAELLPKSCLMKFSPVLCYFPEYLVPDVQTPLFLLESAFDKYQIQENLFSPNSISERWLNCTHTNLLLCNWTEIQIMKDFRTTLLSTLTNTISDASPSSRGYFVHSCYVHGHIKYKATSTCSSLVGTNVLANRTVAEAIGDWYFDRRSFQEIDHINDLPRNCTSAYRSWAEFDKNAVISTTTLRITSQLQPL